MHMPPPCDHIDTVETMKDRIRQLMLAKGMTQKTFASELCIAEATLSGIYNGRTRPTNQTISAIHERFPDVNISWLMFGEGDMYVSSPSEQHAMDDHAEDAGSRKVEDDLFCMPHVSAEVQGGGNRTMEPIGTQAMGTPVLPLSAAVGGNGAQSPAPSAMSPQIQYIEKYIDKPQRKITEIRIFFDDGTYETFTP